MPTGLLAAALAALLTAAVGTLGYLALPTSVSLPAAASASAVSLRSAPAPPAPGASSAESRWPGREAAPARTTSILIRPSPPPPAPPPASSTSPPARFSAPAAALALTAPPASDPPTSRRLGERVPAAIRRWEPLILRHAAANGLDPHLLAALMHVESAGREDAVSPKNAIGLMQVLDGPADPDANVAAGAAILASHLRTFGDLDLALAAYNAGPGAVRAHGGVPPYDETQWHVYLTRWWYWAYTQENPT